MKKNFSLLLVMLMSLTLTLTTGFTVGSSIKASSGKKGDNKTNASANKAKKNPMYSRGMKAKSARRQASAATYYSGNAIVLTYHHISTIPYADISVKPERFESDLLMLIDHGFHVIPLRQLLDAMNNKASLPDNAVVITFDDGMGSFYKYAYPLLQEYNMPATEFLITTRNETYKPGIADSIPLSPAQIKEMSKSGLIDFQSHTHCSHEQVVTGPGGKKGPKLTSRIYNPETKTLESEEDYQKRVIADLSKSTELIEKYTGHTSDVLCFPYGAYNDKVIGLAEGCGYQYFVTTTVGINKEGSGKNKVMRIRAGDAKLSSEKLLQSILDTENSYQ